VSPGGVGMYARVSRAGVHKRMKEGRLTAFLFDVVRNRPASGGGGDPAGEVGGGRPVTYIPVQECRAWARLLDTVRRGEQVTKAPVYRASQPDSVDSDSWRQW
jgi:hypothetical protein